MNSFFCSRVILLITLITFLLDRAINYDEKDPFLCHVCGFCKYAKFDFTLTARQVCAIEPIDNDEDRKKIASTINQLLEKADRMYKTLVNLKPFLEVFSPPFLPICLQIAP